MWEQEGIEYVKPTNIKERHRFKYPVHNINAVAFLHLLRASNFGNRRIYDDSFGAILVYSGHKATTVKAIPVNNSNLSAVIAELKEQGEARRELGNRYMYMGTSGSIYSLPCPHAENIDIDALLSLDLDNMQIGRAYLIGDRNWGGQDVSQDVPRLALRKVDDAPTYEFGTLQNGFQFERESISMFEIYE
ncbi:MAG: hypothetical protein LBD34_01995 [Puniceicoccales bacterium]|jgi:hypothetical protein|nr:hypothetical protein [Puniceicoccales bacterium]